MVATAGIIIIGDEILTGRTSDLNINWIAKELNLIGVRLKEARVIPDEKKIIINSIKSFKQKFTYVFTCGGIGPTHDDITTESVADALSLELEKNEEAMKRLKKHYSNTKIEFNEARQKMAVIPIGAKLIDNAVSAAPGFNIDNLFVFAGVPRIMQSMFDSIKGNLIGGKIIFDKTLTCDLGEGVIAKSLEEIENKYKNLKIGSYPYFKPEGYGTSLVLRSEKKETTLSATADLIKIIHKKGGNTYFLD